MPGAGPWGFAANYSAKFFFNYVEKKTPDHPIRPRHRCTETTLPDGLHFHRANRAAGACQRATGHEDKLLALTQAYRTPTEHPRATCTVTTCCERRLLDERQRPRAWRGRCCRGAATVHRHQLHPHVNPALYKYTNALPSPLECRHLPAEAFTLQSTGWPPHEPRATPLARSRSLATSTGVPRRSDLSRTFASTSPRTGCPRRLSRPLASSRAPPRPSTSATAWVRALIVPSLHLFFPHGQTTQKRDEIWAAR